MKNYSVGYVGIMSKIFMIRIRMYVYLHFEPLAWHSYHRALVDVLSHGALWQSVRTSSFALLSLPL